MAALTEIAPDKNKGIISRLVGGLNILFIIARPLPANVKFVPRDIHLARNANPHRALLALGQRAQPRRALVAIVWQDFLARCYPLILLPAGRLVLFLSVWAIYIADRMIDVRAPSSRTNPRGTALPYEWGVGRRAPYCRGAGGLLAVVLWLRPAVLQSGLLIGALVVLYMAVYPCRGTRRTRWKQPAAAALFTMGVLLIGWMGPPIRGAL